jgi:putative tryptophan/tyrosine transport system substrate-binding protein
MRRRDFITLVGGAAAWPVAARAQQAERVRRIGVLEGGVEANDPNLAEFGKVLQGLGWTDGRNVRFDYRFGGADRDLMRKYAEELVALNPDILLANGSGALAPLQQTTRTVPIVFVSVVDPVALGFVASLARPGGNVTGFTNFDYSLAGKWLELLKQIAPRITRVAVLRDPTQFAGAGQLGAIQAAASSLQVELSPVDVRNDKEIERAITTMGAGPNGGLIVQSSFAASVHLKSIVALAAKHRVPAVYSRQPYVAAGGLVSYGPDTIDQYRRAAGYVDRILKGENPAELPVQNPNKYELVINSRTARVLGLTIPPSLLAIADEVIE